MPCWLEGCGATLRAGYPRPDGERERRRPERCRKRTTCGVFRVHTRLLPAWVEAYPEWSASRVYSCLSSRSRKCSGERIIIRRLRKTSSYGILENVLDEVVRIIVVAENPIVVARLPESPAKPRLPRIGRSLFSH